MSFLNVFKQKNKDDIETPAPTVNLMLDTPKKIVVVEDEPALRELYVEVIKGAGFEVSSAGNGQEGLTLISSFHPDLILLDLMMPIMDGKTMLMKLRDIPEFKRTPVIVLTNAGDADSLTQTKLYGGAAAFLIKSNVTPQDVLDSIRTLA